MTHGIPVLLPRSLARRFGAGPVYAAAAEMMPLASAIHADPAQRQLLRKETVEHARQSYPAARHAERLRELIGPPARRARPSASGRRRRKRVLFVSSNGFGLGHLTRLLAVARRMPGDIEPVFATMSQAMPIVRQAGYPVEYLPGNTFGNVSSGDWNGWLALQFSQIVDFHRPAAVVFDGGLPYQGILQTVARREEARLVWIRRGMWRDIQENDELIARQRFFDLVIEPADIAAAHDRGATVRWRGHALHVPPVALLDEGELFDRAEAAARLGLDPQRPAALIQLGSGANRDIVGMTGEVLQALAARPAIQPVLLEWLIASAELDLWPGVRRLKGFPVAKYYRAFDFTISAAGYNSFNEVIAFGLPAIFVSNEHPMLDDQRGRATFAEENGAALRVAETQLHALGSLVDAILDEKVQWLMKSNCRRLAQPNGAGDAAAAVARLVGVDSHA
jgi:UDP:flavonoid glycosyltransferase YjiC (YdhE family)